MRNDLPVQVSGGLLIFLAAALLILPFEWVLAAIIAATFHELCHIVAIKLCGCKITAISLGIGGAQIQMSTMGQGRELICALAGPLGGILLLIPFRIFPRLALCALMHSLYNLIPVYPLDGGRALRCGAALLLPPLTADRLCVCVQRLCLCVLFLLGMWGCMVLRLGFLPLVLAAGVVIKSGMIKIPCKHGLQRVQ